MISVAGHPHPAPVPLPSAPPGPPSPPFSPFIELGPDLFFQILTRIAGEPLDTLSTDAYRRLLPFAICCTQHYHLTKSAIRGLAVLPLHFTIRQSRHKPDPIPPFPTVLFRLPAHLPPPHSAAHQPLRGIRAPPRVALPEWDVIRAVSRFPSLRVLRLFRTTRITNAGLSAILDATPHLRELRVPANQQITVTALQGLPRCVSLHTLDLSYCTNLGDEVAGLLCEMPALRALNVAYWKITDEFIRVVAACAKLERLDVSACPRLTGRAAVLVGERAARLQVFHFRCSGLLDDAGVVGLSVCSTLRTVDLSLAKGITDAAVVGLGDPERMPFLESVRLSDCKLLSDGAVVNLSSNRNIRHLDLSFCDMLTDRAVDAMRKLAALEDIDLSGCTHLTDLSVSLLAEFASLRCLRLAYCSGITDACVGSLCTSPNVPFHMIDVRNCRGIQSTGLRRLDKVCGSLLAIGPNDLCAPT